MVLLVQTNLFSINIKLHSAYSWNTGCESQIHKNEFTNWKLSILSLFMALYFVFIYFFSTAHFMAINRFVFIFLLCLFAKYFFIFIVCRRLAWLSGTKMHEKSFYAIFQRRELQNYHVCKYVHGCYDKFKMQTRENFFLHLLFMFLIYISIRGRLTWWVWVCVALFIHYYEQFPYKKNIQTRFSHSKYVYSSLSPSFSTFQILF